jgi:hypothetical protein
MLSSMTNTSMASICSFYERPHIRKTRNSPEARLSAERASTQAPESVAQWKLAPAALAPRCRPS